MFTQLHKVITAIIVGLVLVGGGFAAGRYAAPDKVVVTERVVQVEKQVVVVQTKTEIKVVRVKDVAKDVHTEVTTIKAPDGTVTVKAVSDDKTKTHSDTKSDTTEQTSKTVEKLVYKDRETIKTVERNRPSWSLALQPGYDFAGALGHGAPVNLLPSSLTPFKRVVLGASIEHRVVGPLSAGVWANSQGTGGLVIRLEF